MHKTQILRHALCLLVLVCVGPAWGAQMFIYPSKGQSQEQQDRDRFECHTWSVKQTGFDPTAPQTAQAPPPPSEPRQGGVVRGGARGAATGAVVGGITGKPGKGAAIGAAAGGLFGGIRRRDQVRREQHAQAQYAQQQQAQAAHDRGNYDRALRTCLAGRGYTVN
jgi:hypothetical protein